jgi:hypothetical protein
MIILWAFVLSLILCMHNLNLVICGIIEVYFKAENEPTTFYIYFQISLFPVDAFVGALTTCSLIYLFSYLAERVQII